MPSKAFTEFHGKLTDLEAARSRFESTLSTGPGASGDILMAYEGLFLRLVVALESYLDKYLAELLDKSHTSTTTGFAIQVTFTAPAVREAVILNLDDYKDWLPYDRTIKIAELYLKDGVPFTLAGDDERGHVKSMYIIRNAIAHSSAHAQRTFRDKVIGSAKLPPDEMTPAGYLRGAYRSTPRATRLELFFQHLLKLAQTIDP